LAPAVSSRAALSATSPLPKGAGDRVSGRLAVEYQEVGAGNLQPATGQRRLCPYYRAIRAQTHLQLPKVSTCRARHVEIAPAHKMNVHCDDRIICTTPLTITADPGAVRVLVDRL
jgi:hypothetical protein